MLRIVALSDTHSLHRKVDLPEGDVLIHCGDWTYRGEEDIYLDAFEWLKEQSAKYKHIICIMGNHDFKHKYFVNLIANSGISNIHYLENSDITIDGIKFYGLPNVSNLHRWNFNDDKDFTCWARIPDDVEILISHTPPLHILDESEHYGSGALREHIDYRLLNNKLKVNVFGHCHKDAGRQVEVINDEGRHVLFVNASICDIEYEATNKPMVIEI